ncbi:MAG: glycosyltransferase [Chloroflexales bacterium]|nr:glycosyltransferase [Chloroflexales bacterium]
MSCILDTVSVIIPTRNERRNIAAFLRSLHPDVELVVVDASDDGTDMLISQLRPIRTQVIRSSSHIALARQIGARVARGDWLIFSDADVTFEPGYFDYLARHVTGDAFYGPKYATTDHPRYSQFFNACQRFCHRLGIPAASGSNMGMRRSVFERLNGFRLDLSVNEDTELMMRAKRKNIQADYVRQLAVRSIDDRRLDRGVIFKTLHSLSRNAMLFINLYIPLPQCWLRHDWGYWRIHNARRSDLRDLSA